MALRCLLVPLALLTLACAPTDPTTLVIQSRTEQGLFQLARVVAVARVQVLKEGGTSANFTSDILPASMVTVHTEGRIRVARGTVLLTFVDREGAPSWCGPPPSSRAPGPPISGRTAPGISGTDSSSSSSPSRVNRRRLAGWRWK